MYKAVFMMPKYLEYVLSMEFFDFQKFSDIENFSKKRGKVIMGSKYPPSKILSFLSKRNVLEEGTAT